MVRTRDRLVIPITTIVTLAWLVSLGALVIRGSSTDLTGFLTLSGMMGGILTWVLEIKPLKRG